MQSNFLDIIKKHENSIKGRLLYDTDMAKIVWFRTGGKAQLIFEPADETDLANFLRILPLDVPIITIGFGSNMLVRDGGLPMVVIRLGAKNFGNVKLLGADLLEAQCGVSDKKLSLSAAKAGIADLHFYAGIPGNLGGAIAMNAGANGLETSDVVVSARAMQRNGEIIELTKDELGFSYRECKRAKDLIFLSAILRGKVSSEEAVMSQIQQVISHREECQPVREKTGGSTFKNPPHNSAWKLIDQAGCRGFCFGDAQISEKHCNFMINKANATSYELEELGEIVRKRVYEKTGIILQWEIQRIGEFLLNKKVNSFEKI